MAKELIILLLEHIIPGVEATVADLLQQAVTKLKAGDNGVAQP